MLFASVSVCTVYFIVLMNCLLSVFIIRIIMCNCCFALLCEGSYFQLFGDRVWF